MEITPRGFIPSEIKPEDYVHGDHKLGDVVINPSGQWTDYLPLPEDQNFAMEPEACTSYGTLAAVQTLMKFSYKDADNYSQRFLAFVSGTTQYGNDPQTVAETLRKTGDVLENDWPYTTSDNTWATFYEQPPKPLYTKALEFIAKYSFGHSWVRTDADSMKNALMYSPLGAAGFAWAQDADGLYYTPQGIQPCHWFVIVGYVDGQYWSVWDSYKPELKKLRWDYQFTQVKRYTLTANVGTSAAQQSAWARFVNLINTWVQQQLGLGDYHKDRLGGASRSPEWPKVRAAHLLKEPVCQICGGKDKLNVHHVLPFHIDKSLELNPDNLITLCNGSSDTISCHIRMGHFDNFRTKWNPNIKAEAELWRKRFAAQTEDDTI